LYAAVSIGLQTSDLIAMMERLCKHDLPEAIIKNVEICTLSYGKVKLVLKHNRYFIESAHSDVIQKLLKDEVIQGCILDENSEAKPDDKVAAPEEKRARVESVVANTVVETSTVVEEDIDNFYDKIMGDDQEDENAEAIRTLQVLTFEIKPNTIETVQKRCIEMDYPLLAEYDFRNDSFNPNLGIDLKPSTKLR
jgi:DNA excision repair protein ERCC-3